MRVVTDRSNDPLANDVSTTWTREFNNAIEATGLLLDGADGWSILNAPEDEPLLVWLERLDEADFARIAQFANRVMEETRFTPAHIERAIKRTIWHWSSENED